MRAAGEDDPPATDRAEREHPDTCSGILITLLALVLLGMSLRLPIGSLRAPGSGAFPLLLSLVMAVLGFVLTIQQVRAGFSWGAARHLSVAYGPPLSIFAILVCGYVFTFEIMGFVINTTFFLAIMLWYFQRVTLGKSISYALTLTIITYILFNHVFQLRLPAGLLAVG